MQLANLPGAFLYPGGEDHLRLPICIQVDHRWFAAEAKEALGGVVDRVGPVAVFAFVQPVGVDAPIIRRMQDFQFPIAVQIGGHGVGLVVLDDIVILADGCGAAIRGRQHGPIEPAALPAGAIPVQDIRDFVQVGIGVGVAVVHAAHHDRLQHAVAVDIYDNWPGLIEIGTVFAAALGIAAQINLMIDVHTHPAPHFGRLVVVQTVDCAGEHLLSIILESGDIVGVVRPDDLGAPIAIQIAGSHIFVITTGGVAVGIRVWAVLRPTAAAQCAIMLEDIPLILAAGGGHDNLQVAVAFQVVGRQRAQFTARRHLLRPNQVELLVENIQPAALVSGDDFQVAVAFQVGQHQRGPLPPAFGIAFVFQGAGLAIQDVDGIVGADHLRYPVAIQIGHGRR